MNTGTNKICAECSIAQNSLNGRYCNKLRKYVEYAKAPPCGKTSVQEPQIQT